MVAKARQTLDLCHKGRVSRQKQTECIVLCKVMEHIIASDVAKHLDSNGLMYDLGMDSGRNASVRHSWHHSVKISLTGQAMVKAGPRSAVDSASK